MASDTNRAGAGVLVAIGGAEDKLGHRTVLNHFVQLAGGRRARAGRGGGAGHRGVHDRRQPAAAVDGGVRDPAGGGSARSPPARRGHRRHLGRGERPQRPHGRLRRPGRGPQAAPGAHVGRARAAPRGGHRPALQPAQPAGAAAAAGGRVPQPARDRDRRGHRRRHQPRRGAGGARQGHGHGGGRVKGPVGRLRGPGPAAGAGVGRGPARPPARLPVRPRRPGAAAPPQGDRDPEAPGAPGGGRGAAAGPGGQAPPHPRRRGAGGITVSEDLAARAEDAHPSTSEEPARPRPDLTILEARVYRGPNYWSYDKAIHLLVDLGSLEDFPSNLLPGFTDDLLALLPGLADHTCGVGRKGGFVERLRDGTWLGHVAEHVALKLQREAGGEQRRGKTRGAGKRGQYNVIYGYGDDQVGLAAGRLAVRLVNHLVEREPGFDFEAELERFILRAERTAFGPSTQAILDEAAARDIPWLRIDEYSLVQLGQGIYQQRIRATMTSRTSSLAVDVAGDKELTTRLLAA